MQADIRGQRLLNNLKDQISFLNVLHVYWPFDRRAGMELEGCGALLQAGGGVHFQVQQRHEGDCRSHEVN